MKISPRTHNILLRAALLAAVGDRLEAIEPAREYTVPVCVERGSHAVIVHQAQVLAGRMFETIGVIIEWHDFRSCPLAGGQAILVIWANPIDGKNRPFALAYSQPFEGTHIRIYYDRVAILGPGGVPYLLAHVLTHEITHMLQGTDRHSDSGVMKARWNAKDCFEMTRKPLSFTEADVQLILFGAAARVAAAGVHGTPKIRRRDETPRNLARRALAESRGSQSE